MYKSIQQLNGNDIQPVIPSVAPSCGRATTTLVLPMQQSISSLSHSPPGHLRAIEFGLYGTGVFYSGILHADVDRSQVREQLDEWSLRQFFDLANAVSAHNSVSRWRIAHQLYDELLRQVTSLTFSSLVERHQYSHFKDGEFVEIC